MCFFRLEAYDRNENFGAKEPEQYIEWHMKVPNPSAYRDINKDSPIPKVTKALLTTYLKCHGTTKTTKVDNLYNDKYLEYVRFANVDDATFIHGKCHAEMYRKVSYFIDVKLQRDTGVILEAQCDCGAGMGPDAHCKHVQTVI